MSIRFASDEEVSRWGVLIAANPDGGDVFQSKEFGEVKRRGGWIPRYLLSDKGVAMTVLEKSIPLLGRLWYIPRGPGVVTVDSLPLLTDELRTYTKRHHPRVFAIKIEPPLVESEQNLAALAELDLAKVRPIQPNHSTVLIDLSPSLDTILSSLNQKGRHAIRRAERDGVTARAVECNDKTMMIMFNLLQETAEGKFNTRPYEYYREYWKSFADRGDGQLFFSYYNNTVVAGAYAISIGANGTYKDGASVRKRTAYGASHLLQWEVIKWMKSRGVKLYDLCGTPHSREVRDANHPLYGLGRFKTSFNKHVTDFVGAYDVVLRRRSYYLWSKIGERIVIRLSRAISRQYWY